jgi:hypothetical protein
MTVCDKGEGTLCSIVRGLESEVSGALGLEGVSERLVPSETFRALLREVLESSYADFRVQTLHDFIHIVAARGS